MKQWEHFLCTKKKNTTLFCISTAPFWRVSTERKLVCCSVSAAPHRYVFYICLRFDFNENRVSGMRLTQHSIRSLIKNIYDPGAQNQSSVAGVYFLRYNFYTVFPLGVFNTFHTYALYLFWSVSNLLPRCKHETLILCSVKERAPSSILCNFKTGHAASPYVYTCNNCGGCLWSNPVRIGHVCSL